MAVIGNISISKIFLYLLERTFKTSDIGLKSGLKPLFSTFHSVMQICNKRKKQKQVQKCAQNFKSGLWDYIAVQSGFELANEMLSL